MKDFSSEGLKIENLRGKLSMTDSSQEAENQQRNEEPGQQDSFLLGVFTKDGKLLSQAEVSADQLPTLLAATAERHSEKANAPAKKRERLPALTSGHRTNLPNTPTFEALRQSFGPGVGVQLSLWPNTSEARFELTMPNGGSLLIAGNSPSESIVLYQYVTSEVGPEGLKHLLVLLDVYYVKTGGRDRKADASVSVRQLLVRMGKGKKADDREEQQKFMKTILYLARTLVSPEAKRKASPLLIIEGLLPDEQGNFLIPSEIEYHLGQYFFETLFGKQPQYFSVPTAQLLAYHSTREQQELLLAFYLSNKLTFSGNCSINFPTLLIQSALQSREDIERGGNRTRDAQRVLYALERLERDGLIIRSAHEEIDTVLAVDLHFDRQTTKKLSNETEKRLRQLLPSLLRGGKDAATLRSKRRIALQRLLELDPSDQEKQALPITFFAGRLLQKQMESSYLHSEQGIVSATLLSTEASSRRKDNPTG